MLSVSYVNGLSVRARGISSKETEGSKNGILTMLRMPNNFGHPLNEWKNPQNALVRDNLFTFSKEEGMIEDYFDFHFPIVLPKSGTQVDGPKIHGIEVFVEMKSKSKTGIYVSLSGDGGNSYTKEKFVGPAGSNKRIYLVGGPNSKWGKEWKYFIDSELTDENFRLRIRSQSDKKILVDSLKVKIYYSPFN